MHNFGVQAELSAHGKAYFLSFKGERLPRAPTFLTLKILILKMKGNFYLKDN